ncbi:unnamed protein product, partial [Phaeothamnion confervicola]
SAPGAAAAPARSGAAGGGSTAAAAGSSVKKAGAAATGLPAPALAVPLDADNYEMSDRDCSDSESGSGDEDDGGGGGGGDGGDGKEAAPRKPKKHIPAWAQGTALREALERQYNGMVVDPDAIFPEISTCDLEAIFQTKKKRYAKRGSSANWHNDRIKPDEYLVYKRSVGIDT